MLAKYALVLYFMVGIIMLSGTNGRVLPWQAEMMKLHNEKRVEAGLSPLCINEKLNEVAGDYSEKLTQTNTFSHTGTDGSTPARRIETSGFKAGSTGENIASPGPTADAFSRLFASPLHKENILSPKYEMMGIGGLTESNEHTGNWVINFAARGPGSGDSCLNPNYSGGSGTPTAPPAGPMASTTAPAPGTDGAAADVKAVAPAAAETPGAVPPAAGANLDVLKVAAQQQAAALIASNPSLKGVEFAVNLKSSTGQELGKCTIGTDGIVKSQQSFSTSQKIGMNSSHLHPFIESDAAADMADKQESDLIYPDITSTINQLNSLASKYRLPQADVVRTTMIPPLNNLASGSFKPKTLKSSFTIKRDVRLVETEGNQQDHPTRSNRSEVLDKHFHVAQAIMERLEGSRGIANVEKASDEVKIDAGPHPEVAETGVSIQNIHSHHQPRSIRQIQEDVEKKLQLLKTDSLEIAALKERIHRHRLEQTAQKRSLNTAIDLTHYNKIEEVGKHVAKVDAKIRAAKLRKSYIDAEREERLTGNVEQSSKCKLSVKQQLFQAKQRKWLILIIIGSRLQRMQHRIYQYTIEQDALKKKTKSVTIIQRLFRRRMVLKQKRAEERAIFTIGLCVARYRPKLQQMIRKRCANTLMDFFHEVDNMSGLLKIIKIYRYNVIACQRHIRKYLEIKTCELDILCKQWDKLEPIWWQKRAAEVKREATTKTLKRRGSFGGGAAKAVGIPDAIKLRLLRESLETRKKGYRELHAAHRVKVAEWMAKNKQTNFGINAPSTENSDFINKVTGQPIHLTFKVLLDNDAMIHLIEQGFLITISGGSSAGTVE